MLDTYLYVAFVNDGEESDGIGGCSPTETRAAVISNRSQLK